MSDLEQPCPAHPVDPDDALGSGESEGVNPPAAPEDVRDAARDAFDKRALYVDVADIVHDSLVDLTDVEPTEGERELVFVSGDMVVDMEIAASASGEKSDITVFMAPARQVEITVRTETGIEFVAVLDEMGHGQFQLPAGSIASLAFPPATETGRPVQTAWVRV